MTTSAERFSFISQSILNRFTCNFPHTIRSHCGGCPENLVRFDQVFQKLLMWCTETTLCPRRQSAENAGPHWNSTEEVPSPHRTCVTEQLELTRQVAWIERVIINTTSTYRGRCKTPYLHFLMTLNVWFWRQKSSNEKWEKYQDSHNGHKPTVYNAFSLISGHFCHHFYPFFADISVNSPPMFM